MSVLINGMEMPKNCEKCKLSWMDTDHHWYCDANKPWGLDVTDCISDRHVDCPLIEIPDGHGGLIDADAFFKDICNSIENMTKLGVGVDADFLWAKLNDALDNAPTVIPADKDGET